MLGYTGFRARKREREREWRSKNEKYFSSTNETRWNRADAFVQGEKFYRNWLDGDGRFHRSEHGSIRERLKAAGFSGQSLATNLGTVNTFVNVMKKGDIALVKEGERTHIAIVDDSQWKEKYRKIRCSNMRPVQWVAEVNTVELNEKVQTLLKNATTCTKFGYPFAEAEIDSYLPLEYRSSRSSLDAESIHGKDGLIHILHSETVDSNLIITLAADSPLDLESELAFQFAKHHGKKYNYAELARVDGIQVYGQNHLVERKFYFMEGKKTTVVGMQLNRRHFRLHLPKRDNNMV